MQYTSIVIELLLDQYPSVHHSLQEQQLLSQATNQYAAYLKGYHESWMDRLSRKGDGIDPMQLANEALTLAIEDLGHDISTFGPTLNGGDGEPLGLYAAMGVLRRAALSARKSWRTQIWSTPLIAAPFA